MAFKTTILLARKTATGIEVPPDVVEALNGGRKPAVVARVNDYEYRTTVASMGGRFLIPFSSEHRAASRPEAARCSLLKGIRKRPPMLATVVRYS